MSIHREQVRVDTNGIKPWLFYLVFSGLLITNVITMVAFLMSGDIARLLDGQNDRIHIAYQDRIVQLRQEVDRLYSRQYAQAGNVNLQLQELVAQQDVLVEQHQYVKALAAKAQELGLQTAADTTIDKDITTGAINNRALSGPDSVEHLTSTIEQMMSESQLALASLSENAISSTDKIISELDKLGIHPKFPEALSAGIGGPFLVASNDPTETSLVDEANAVVSSFERFRIARNIATQVPIHRPLTKKFRISSKFGNRRDPFLNRSAFHSGMDFAAPSGMQVLSAGPGKIIHAGRRSGYGNVVEVEHVNGLVTRYAHLSAYLVSVGDVVEAGSPIAKVGSTGRSTGPHLHFEVRRNDSPIDPAGFLKAGDRLAAFL